MLERFLKVFEPSFTVLSLIHYTQGVLPVIIIGGASQGDGVDVNSFNYSLQLFLFFLNYLVTVSLLLLRWKKVLYVLRKDWVIWPLLAIAVLSVFWSHIPVRTLRNGIALIGTTLFGLYFATRYSLKDQVRILFWTYTIILCLSILFAIALPKYGIMGGVHAGTLRGVYTHKNIFGKVMALGSAIFLIQAFNEKKHSLRLCFLFTLSLILLVLAQSTAALAIAVILLASLLIYRTFRWHYSIMIPAVFAIATISGGVIIWLTENFASALGAIGEDATLTGRTDIWPFLWEMIQKKPWLGYGFNGFWKGLDGPSAYVWRAVRWSVPDAHNGFLDLLLDLGFVGLAIFAIGFGVNVLRAIARVRLSPGLEGLWPLLFLTYLILANIGESSLLQRNQIYWLLYSAVSFSLLIPSPLLTHTKKLTTPPQTVVG